MNMTRRKFFAVCVAVLIVSLTLTAVLLGVFGDRRIRVACIGDSITELCTYPCELQTLLGADYNVSNFGVSGSTVLTSSHSPYIEKAAFQDAKKYLPNIVVILLGTNDARLDYYKYIDDFVADYTQLILEIQALESKPKIFLVTPPPLFDNDLYLSNDHLLEGIIPGIEEVANEFNLTLVDVYTPLVDHPEYLMDGVHPTNEGAQFIASEVSKAILAD